MNHDKYDNALKSVSTIFNTYVNAENCILLFMLRNHRGKIFFAAMPFPLSNKHINKN